MIDQYPLYGLILAGGKSSRMGFDKSTISYHAKPQIDHVKEILKHCCQKVFVSKGKSQEHKLISENILHDEFKDLEGPLNGIATAIKTFPNTSWLIIPIDMPLLDLDTVDYLVKNRSKEKLATCFKVNNMIEPFPSIWEHTCLEHLLKYIEDNGTSPRRFLEKNSVQFLEPPSPDKFININTPIELGLFKRSNTD